MKYELFKVKRGKEYLGRYILTDIRELMKTGVLLPTDLYKSNVKDAWLPLELSKEETIRRDPKQGVTLTRAEIELQREADKVAEETLFGIWLKKTQAQEVILLASLLLKFS